MNPSQSQFFIASNVCALGLRGLHFRQVATAEGAAQQLLLVAEANAAMALQNGHAEATAYAGVKARLGMTNDELLRYLLRAKSEIRNFFSPSFLSCNAFKFLYRTQLHHHLKFATVTHLTLWTQLVEFTLSVNVAVAVFFTRTPAATSGGMLWARAAQLAVATQAC